MGSGGCGGGGCGGAVMAVVVDMVVAKVIVLCGNWYGGYGGGVWRLWYVCCVWWRYAMVIVCVAVVVCKGSCVCGGSGMQWWFCVW